MLHRLYNRIIPGEHGRPLQQYCQRGHPMTGDNLRILKSGERRCRACAKIRAAALYQRHKEARETTRP